MRLLLNVLWIVFGGGFVIWIEYLLVGLVLCLTLIGIPFGVQCFKIAGLGLMPFGKEIRPGRNVGLASGLGNLLWLIFAGFWIALSHAVLGIGAALTIIGIPFAIQHLKLAQLALWPFGREFYERP
jgi:uncharacterized membrane protein YccF (DUF307 family)